MNTQLVTSRAPVTAKGVAARGDAWVGRQPAVSNPRRLAAFTMLEILLAIAIFAMVVTAVYSSWTAILRASKAGVEASTDMQRTRITSKTLEDALVSAVLFASNPALYAFQADTRGDFAALSFVSRLPPSFPGSGYFGDLVVRRVTFEVKAGEGGEKQLWLHQMPVLQTNVVESDERAILLARDMHTFMLEFCRQKGNGYEWVDEWTQTNQLPKLVRFALAFGQAGDGSGKPKDVVVRTVSIPSIAVPADSQRARVVPGQPGQPPPGTGGAAGGSGEPRPGIQDSFGPPVRRQGSGGR